MAIGDGGKIGIDVEFRLDKLQKDLSKAEQKLKQSANRMNAAAKKAGSGFVEGFAKAFAALGAVEGGVRLVGAALLQIRGDTEGVRTAMEALPLGVGSTVRAFNELGDILSGVKERQQEILDIQERSTIAARERARADAAQEDRNKRIRTERANVADIRGFIQDQEAILLGRTDPIGALKLKQQREAEALRNKFGPDISRDQRDAALGALGARQRAELRDAEAAQAVRTDRDKRERRARESFERDQANSRVQLAKSMRDIAEDADRARHRRLFDTETQLMQLRLEGEDRALDARILGIQRTRNAEIRAAREAREFDRANALRNIRDLEIRAARAADNIQPENVEARAGQFRSVGANQFSFGAAGLSKRKVALEERAQRALDQIARNTLRRENGVAFFGFPGGG